MLYLKTFTFNPFQQNTYLLYTEEGAALLIDAGNSTAGEHEALKRFIGEKQLKPERFLLTHAHIDHILGARFILDTYGLLPEMHESEVYFIERMTQTAGMYGINCEQALRKATRSGWAAMSWSACSRRGIPPEAFPSIIPETRSCSGEMFCSAGASGERICPWAITIP
jgi:glyoxylase-like metal-dependent hydrolase (beta-lactamase superfamily II)